MAVKIKLTDNSRIVLNAMQGNVVAALEAMGTKGKNLVLWQMRQGYGKPIRQTGDLQRDLSYEVDADAQVVRIGNTLHYAHHVHDGTYKMPGRPYLTDGLSGEGHGKQLLNVAQEQLKKGF